jgi:hypothetical protein
MNVVHGISDLASLTYSTNIRQTFPNRMKSALLIQRWQISNRSRDFTPNNVIMLLLLEEVGEAQWWLGCSDSFTRLLTRPGH